MSNVLTKIALSIVTAIAGGAAWLVAEPGAKSVLSMFQPKTAEAAAAPAAAEVKPTPPPTDTALGSSIIGLAELARAAKRPDTEIMALTAASVRISELNTKISGLGAGDGAAIQLLNDDIKKTALDVARSSITAVGADAEKLAAAIRNDFKAGETELATLGKQPDPDTLTASQSALDTQAKIASAVATAMAEGVEPKTALDASAAAHQAMVSLAALRPVASTAYVKGKRIAFDNSLAQSRALAQDIATLAGGKKPSIIASREKKADAKYLADTDAWAKSRIAELEAFSSKIATADRKTVGQYASQATTTRNEIRDALEHCRQAAARLAAK